ncbi:MAG: leucine-rich repeat domain-containing protein [Bacteroidales bacterium]
MKSAVYSFALVVIIGCSQTPRAPSTKSGVINIDSIPAIEPSINREIGDDTLTITDLDSALLLSDRIYHLIITPKWNPSTETSKYYNLKHLPSEISTLRNLTILEIHCLENLIDLPPEIGSLRYLEKLIVDNSNSCTMNIFLPSSIGKLKNLTMLVLFGGLDTRGKSDTTLAKQLPSEITNLLNLEYLDLGRNALTEIQKEIFSLTSLKKLKLSYNRINEIPPYISNLSKLEELELNTNNLHSLPDEISALENLKILNLEVNYIKDIPESFSKLRNLQELNLTANVGIRLPDSLDSIRNLKIIMGNNKLKLTEQKELIVRFKNVKFIFDDEYPDSNTENEH